MRLHRQSARANHRCRCYESTWCTPRLSKRTSAAALHSICFGGIRRSDAATAPSDPEQIEACGVCPPPTRPPPWTTTTSHYRKYAFKPENGGRCISPPSIVRSVGYRARSVHLGSSCQPNLATYSSTLTRFIIARVALQTIPRNNHSSS